MEKNTQNAPGGGLTASCPPLELESFEVLPVRLVFKLAVAHNLAKRQYTENVTLRAISPDLTEGYGECVPRTYITGETPASVIAILNRACSELAGQSFETPADFIHFLDSYELTAVSGVQPAARCCLELALLDLAGKHWNMSVSEMLGLDTITVPLVYSMVIPFLSDKALVPFLAMVADFEFSQIKIKVDNNDPAARVRTIRKHLGDDVELRVDTNCAWTRETAPGFMRELADLGIVSVEQPLAADDLEGMALLRGHGLPKVTLDESVYTERDIERVAALGAADIINIRVSKCGGLMPSIKMIDSATKHGIGVQLGAQVGESCILSAAGAHLAAGKSAFKWLEGCFGNHLLAQDLCEKEIQFTRGGMLMPPTGPGLGITIDSARLDAAVADYHDWADREPEPSGPCAAVTWERT